MRSAMRARVFAGKPHYADAAPAGGVEMATMVSWTCKSARASGVRRGICAEGRRCAAVPSPPARPVHRPRRGGCLLATVPRTGGAKRGAEVRANWPSPPDRRSHAAAGPEPELSLRTSVSPRNDKWITRRSRLFMGLKWNGTPVRFTFSAAGHRAQAQLFDAQQAVIVGVEGNPRMVFRRHPQHFHGDVFQRQQQLGAIGKQQVDVAAR